MLSSDGLIPPNEISTTAQRASAEDLSLLNLQLGADEQAAATYGVLLLVTRAKADLIVGRVGNTARRSRLCELRGALAPTCNLIGITAAAVQVHRAKKFKMGTSGMYTMHVPWPTELTLEQLIELTRRAIAAGPAASFVNCASAALEDMDKTHLIVAPDEANIGTMMASVLMFDPKPVILDESMEERKLFPDELRGGRRGRDGAPLPFHRLIYVKFYADPLTICGGDGAAFIQVDEETGMWTVNADGQQLEVRDYVPKVTTTTIHVFGFHSTEDAESGSAVRETVAKIVGAAQYSLVLGNTGFGLLREARSVTFPRRLAGTPEREAQVRQLEVAFRVSASQPVSSLELRFAANPEQLLRIVQASVPGMAQTIARAERRQTSDQYKEETVQEVQELRADIAAAQENERDRQAGLQRTALAHAATTEQIRVEQTEKTTRVEAALEALKTQTAANTTALAAKLVAEAEARKEELAAASEEQQLAREEIADQADRDCSQGRAASREQNLAHIEAAKWAALGVAHVAAGQANILEHLKLQPPPGLAASPKALSGAANPRFVRLPGSASGQANILEHLKLQPPPGLAASPKALSGAANPRFVRLPGSADGGGANCTLALEAAKVAEAATATKAVEELEVDWAAAEVERKAVEAEEATKEASMEDDAPMSVADKREATEDMDKTLVATLASPRSAGGRAFARARAELQTRSVLSSDDERPPPRPPPVRDKLPAGSQTTAEFLRRLGPPRHKKFASVLRAGSEGSRAAGSHEAAELAAAIRAAGDPLPTGEVSKVATKVAELSSERPPSTFALKRVFISNWLEEQAEPGAGCQAPGVGADAHSTASIYSILAAATRPVGKAAKASTGCGEEEEEEDEHHWDAPVKLRNSNTDGVMVCNLGDLARAWERAGRDVGRDTPESWTRDPELDRLAFRMHACGWLYGSFFAPECVSAVQLHWADGSPQASAATLLDALNDSRGMDCEHYDAIHFCPADGVEGLELVSVRSDEAGSPYEWSGHAGLWDSITPPFSYMEWIDERGGLVFSTATLHALQRPWHARKAERRAARPTRALLRRVYLRWSHSWSLRRSAGFRQQVARLSEVTIARAAGIAWPGRQAVPTSEPADARAADGVSSRPPSPMTDVGETTVLALPEPRAVRVRGERVRGMLVPAPVRGRIVLASRGSGQAEGAAGACGLALAGVRLNVDLVTSAPAELPYERWRRELMESYKRSLTLPSMLWRRELIECYRRDWSACPVQNARRRLRWLWARMTRRAAKLWFREASGEERQRFYAGVVWRRLCSTARMRWLPAPQRTVRSCSLWSRTGGLVRRRGHAGESRRARLRRYGGGYLRMQWLVLRWGCTPAGRRGLSAPWRLRAAGRVRVRYVAQHAQGRFRCGGAIEQGCAAAARWDAGRSSEGAERDQVGSATPCWQKGSVRRWRRWKAAAFPFARCHPLGPRRKKLAGPVPCPPPAEDELARIARVLRLRWAARRQSAAVCSAVISPSSGGIGGCSPSVPWCPHVPTPPPQARPHGRRRPWRRGLPIASKRARCLCGRSDV
jgi:hypothetical protein